jgi:hypothetical protein
MRMRKGKVGSDSIWDAILCHTRESGYPALKSAGLKAGFLLPQDITIQISN